MGTLSVKVHTVDVEIIDDDRVAAAVRRNGNFEPETLEVWGKICEGGKAGIILDVGAYGGLFAIAAVLMKNTAIALEPKPILAKRSRANAALNNVDIKLIQAAASDRDGSADLGFNPDILLTSGSSLNRKGPAKMEVKVMKLDSLNGKIEGKIGAIKIDVEGHEATVVKGAKELIEKHKPVLIIEVMTNEARKKEILELLPDYRCEAHLDQRNLLMVPKDVGRILT